MSAKKERQLNWNNYSWSEFEKICFEYIQTVYSSEFFKTTLTNKHKDGGRDIIIKAINDMFEAWGECKDHHRNIDLSVIGKNVVLAISRKINKVIFFSVSKITLNTKIEILTVAQIHGFEVLFLDETLLDNEILRCESISRKYFREAYEKNLAKTYDEIIIRAVLSEYEYAEDSLDYEKKQYHLENGFDVYLHIFVKNISNKDISDIRFSLSSFNKSDIVFYDSCEIVFNLKSHSDYLISLKGLVSTSSTNIDLPTINLLYTTDKINLLAYPLGNLDASDVWLVPLIGEGIHRFLIDSVYHLHKIVNNGYARCLFIYGISGVGKSRLINEIGNKCNENGFRSFVFDFSTKNEYEVFREVIKKLLFIPKQIGISITFKQFREILYPYNCRPTLQKELYKFLFLEIDYLPKQMLIETLFAFTTYSICKAPIYIAFDNIQEISEESQIILWEFTERVKVVKTNLLILFVENTERKKYTINILQEYLNREILTDNNNYIYSFECSLLNPNEASFMLASLLSIAEENELIIKRIINKIGCRPLDIFLIAKTFKQEKDILIKKNEKYIFGNLSALNNLLDTLPNSLEKVIENRCKSVFKQTPFDKICEQIISLLVLFNGQISYQIYNHFGFSSEALKKLQDSLIIKNNLHTENITFYHDSLFLFCSKHYYLVQKEYLNQIVDWFELKQVSEPVISLYTYLKALIQLSENEKAICFGLKIIKKELKNNPHEIFSVTKLLLPIVDCRREPLKYFNILYQHAVNELEVVNISDAYKSFETLYNHVIEYDTVLGYECVKEFYHSYSNSKIHILQFNKAEEILINFTKKCDTYNWKHPIFIENRLCVVYFCLGQKDKALAHINNAIKMAEKEKDYFWLSTVYSDKGYTYYITGNSLNARELAIKCFYKAQEYYKLYKDNSVYRPIEMLRQKALINILKGEINKAKTAIDEATNKARKTLYYYQLIPALNLQAFIYIYLNDFSAAKQILNESLSYAAIFSIRKAMIAIHSALGSISLIEEPKQIEKGIEHYQTACKILQEICTGKNDYRFLGCVANLIRLYVQMGKNEEAHQLLIRHSEKRLCEHYNRCLTIYTNNGKFEQLDYGLINYKGFTFLF